MKTRNASTTLMRTGLAATVLVAIAAATAEAALSKPSPEARFAAENREAMDRMMAGMHVASTGDVDRDFAASMTAHHQGAIDMAKSELRYGRNEQLRRIAQQIVVEQQQEIEAMRRAVRGGTTP